MHDAAERDRRLAAEAGAGDDRAFEELVGRYRPSLVRFVARRSGRGALAEDAVQEALVSAHRALRAGKRPADVRAWLHTIAWRRALDLGRGERAGVPLDVAEAAVATADPADAVLAAVEIERTLRHWADLPARQRRALALSVLEGRSLTDIAASLDITVEAAKALVARSRRTLSARLAAEDRRCDAVAPEILRAAERGTRLPGAASRHVAGCRTCSRLHRDARRRRRLHVLAAVPLALADRVRDALAGATAVKAGAATVLAGGALGAGVALQPGGGEPAAPGPPAARAALPDGVLGGDVRRVPEAELRRPVFSDVEVRDAFGRPVATHACRWTEPQADDAPCLAFSGDPPRAIAAVRDAGGRTAIVRVRSPLIDHETVLRVSRRGDWSWLLRTTGRTGARRIDAGFVCTADGLQCRPWRTDGRAAADDAIRAAARRLSRR